MFIATIVVAFMYLCMCLAMSEMSTMLPTAGGGYSFARTAFAPFGGYLTGSAILIEYAIAPVALMVFIFGMLPHFNSANLFDIAVSTEAAGASSFLPLGYLGI